MALGPSEEQKLAGASLVAHRVIEHVRQRPGSSLQEIADQVGVTRTAIVYHVRRLQKLRLLSTLRQGNRVLHFPVGTMQPAHQSLLGVLRLRNAATILTELQRDMG